MRNIFFSIIFHSIKLPRADFTKNIFFNFIIFEWLIYPILVIIEIVVLYRLVVVSIFKAILINFFQYSIDINNMYTKTLR